VSLPLTTTPEAESQIRTIDVWWRDNRRAAPDLFLDELSEAFGLSGFSLAHRTSVADIGAPRSPVHVTCCCERRVTTSTTFQVSTT